MIKHCRICEKVLVKFVRVEYENGVTWAYCSDKCRNSESNPPKVVNMWDVNEDNAAFVRPALDWGKDRCPVSKIDGDGDAFRCKKGKSHDGEHDFETCCGHVSPIGISMVCSLLLGHEGMHANKKKMSSWPTAEQNAEWETQAKAEDLLKKNNLPIEALPLIAGFNPIRPDYYHGTTVDDFIAEFHLGFRLGSVVKYIARHEHKDKTRDLEKALWYLQREVDERKGQELDPSSIIEAAKAL